MPLRASRCYYEDELLCSHNPIVRDEAHRLESRLRDQSAVERVAVVVGQARHFGDVIEREWQWGETTR